MASCPDGESLQRFAEGSASRGECRIVVRHLLARCGVCAARLREALQISCLESRVPEVFAMNEVGRLVLGLLSPPCPQGGPSFPRRGSGAQGARLQERADASRNVR